MRLLASRTSAALLAPALALSLAACGDDTVTGTPIDDPIREVTVNANSPAYVSLTDGPLAVTVADPAASAAWDLALNATAITTNAGAGISVHCLCANSSATTEQVAAMTAANQLGAFAAVGSAQVPHDSLFAADVFAPAVSGWYTGSGTAAIADTGRLILLRRGTATVTFVKARVTAITGAAAGGPASVTIEYAVQLTAGGTFDTVRTTTLTAGSRFEFTTRTAGTASDWDLQLDGWNLEVNSGASGAGSTLGIGFASPFASFTAATAAMVQPSTFRRDGYSSVFGSRAWYRYNITGSDNQIWPTFNVYLVKRGTAVHKVQVTGYYNLAGESRHITVRAARIQ